MTARNAAIDRELVKERAWREDTRFWEAQWRRSLWALARHRTAC